MHPSREARCYRAIRQQHWLGFSYLTTVWSAPKCKRVAVLLAIPSNRQALFVHIHTQLLIPQLAGIDINVPLHGYCGWPSAEGFTAGSTRRKEVARPSGRLQLIARARTNVRGRHRRESDSCRRALIFTRNGQVSHMKGRNQGSGIVTSLKIKPELNIESGERVRRVRGNECRSRGVEWVKESSNAKSRSRKSTPTKARTESSEQDAGRPETPNETLGLIR